MSAVILFCITVLRLFDKADHIMNSAKIYDCYSVSTYRRDKRENHVCLFSIKQLFDLNILYCQEDWIRLSKDASCISLFLQELFLCCSGVLVWCYGQ